MVKRIALIALAALAGCEQLELVPNRHPTLADRDKVIASGPCRGPLTPESAKSKAIKASKTESAKVCAEIESGLAERFNGTSFTTTFMSHHPYTAHYVGQHFAASWSVVWLRFNPDWNEWTVTLRPKPQIAQRPREPVPQPVYVMPRPWPTPMTPYYNPTFPWEHVK